MLAGDISTCAFQGCFRDARFDSDRARPIHSKSPIAPEAVHYLLSIDFSEADRARMQELMDKSDEGALIGDGKAELDGYTLTSRWKAWSSTMSSCRNRSGAASRTAEPRVAVTLRPWQSSTGRSAGAAAGYTATNEGARTDFGSRPRRLCFSTARAFTDTQCALARSAPFCQDGFATGGSGGMS